MNSRLAASAGAFFARLGFGTITFLLPYSLGTKEAAIVGFIIALRPMAEMTAAVPCGIFSDTIGRKIPLVIGLVVTGLTISLFGVLRNPIQLAVASAAMGLSEALVVTSALALMMDCSSPNERGSGIGTMVAALSAGSFVGFVAAGFLASKVVEPILYIVPGAFSVTVGVAIGLSNSTSSPRTSRKLEQPLATLMHKQGWLLASILIVLVLVSTASIFLPLYARQTRLSPTLASVSYVALVLIALASYVVGGRLSDSWGRYKLMYTGLGFVLVAEIALIWGYSSENWETIFAFLALASTGVGAYAPSALALLGDTSPKGAYGTSMGTYDSLLSLSEIIGPIATGAIVGFSGFSTLAVFGAFAALLDIFLVRFGTVSASSAMLSSSDQQARTLPKRSIA